MKIMIDPEIPAWYLMSLEGSRQTINMSYDEAVKRRESGKNLGGVAKGGGGKRHPATATRRAAEGAGSGNPPFRRGMEW